VRERVFLGEQRPIAIERPRIKEADPAVIGFEGTTRDTALIPQMEEIGANLLLAEHLGRAHVVRREPADCLDVHVLGPLGETGKPHVIDHTLTQRGHGHSPFRFKFQELCPGTPSRYTSAQPSTIPPLRRSRSVQPLLTHRKRIRRRQNRRRAILPGRSMEGVLLTVHVASGVEEA